MKKKQVVVTKLRVQAALSMQQIQVNTSSCVNTWSHTLSYVEIQRSDLSLIFKDSLVFSFPKQHEKQDLPGW